MVWFGTQVLNTVRGGGPDDDAAGNATDIAAAVAAAGSADVTVLVLGDSMSTAREGADRDTLDLAGSQMALLTAVASAVRDANTNGVHGQSIRYQLISYHCSQVNTICTVSYLWRLQIVFLA